MLDERASNICVFHARVSVSVSCGVASVLCVALCCCSSHFSLFYAVYVSSVFFLIGGASIRGAYGGRAVWEWGVRGWGEGETKRRYPACYSALCCQFISYTCAISCNKPALKETYGNITFWRRLFNIYLGVCLDFWHPKCENWQKISTFLSWNPCVLLFPHLSVSDIIGFQISTIPLHLNTSGI